MVNVEELKRERAATLKRMREINDGAAQESRRLTEVEAAEWEKLQAEEEDLTSQIARGEKLNELEMREGNGAQGSPEAPPAKKIDDRESGQAWQSPGEFLQAVYRAAQGDVDDRLVESRAASGINQGVPTEGGFLVGTDMMGGLMKLAYERSLVAGRCRRQPVGPNANGIIWNELDEKSRVAGARNGGIRVYRRAEASAYTGSQPKFAQREMKLDKLTALVYLTEEMLQDSVGLEAFVGDLVSDELAWVLDDEIIRGTGSGMPQGILGADATITASKETGQAATTIVWENLLKMRMRVWGRSRPNMVWYVNQDTEFELATMAFMAGTNGVPVYLPAGGASVDGYDRIFGRPVIPIEQCSTLGTVGDIIAADMGQYMIVEKGGVQQASSMHVRFLNDEMAFKWSIRNNGGPGPNWAHARTPANGTNTVSPWVALETRS